MLKLRFIITGTAALGCLAAADAMDSPNLFGIAFLIAFVAGGMGGFICAHVEAPTD